MMKFYDSFTAQANVAVAVAVAIFWPKLAHVIVSKQYTFLYTMKYG